MSFWKALLRPAPPPAPPLAETGPRLFVPPGHYYSPIVEPVEAELHFATFIDDQAPVSLAGIDIDPQRMLALWDDLVPLMADAGIPDDAAEGARYHYHNTSYAWGDGMMLNAMVRRQRPKRVVEVGSGYSSACLIDTLERHQPEGCEVTFIEPYPDLLRQLVGPALDRHRLQPTPVQACPMEVFAGLQAEDILFIDSTHVLKTGSDVWFELFRVLPTLAPGVLIHIHDMFWPFEYPRHWAVEANQSWNEVYAIQAFLMHNPNYEIVMFNDYLAKVHRPALEASWPRFLINQGGSLWLRKLR